MGHGLDTQTDSEMFRHLHFAGLHGPRNRMLVVSHAEGMQVVLLIKEYLSKWVRFV